MIPRKVVPLIPLLATDHVGELVATRDAIARKLKAAGLDWHDVARALESASADATPSCPPMRAPFASSVRAAGTTLLFGDVARAARSLDRGRLSPREREFIAQMCARGFAFSPSPRQADWLASIYDRLQSRAAA